MHLPDPLRPYADLLRWALAIGVMLALIGVGAYSGYQWQADEVEDAQAAQADAERDRDDWKLAAERYDTAIKLQKGAAKAAIDAALAQKQAVAAAVKRADAAAVRYVAKIEAIDQAIEVAKRDPECREALEAKVCAKLY